MHTELLKSLSVATLLCCTSALSAKESDAPATSVQDSRNFSQFKPKADRVNTRIDYTIWDEALSALVVRMGNSIREGAPLPNPNVGTRRVYGHDSRFRLEGNRVGFSFFSREVIESLTEYKTDLERTANAVDISTLSKNEQLAFWMNLHNVAIIQQIAIEYPLSQPSRMKIGEAGLPLDEAPIITIQNVQMSPRDIRTKIVFPNWKDPKVIYGFFRGDIGGPSVQRKAFTATNLSELLDSSAKEFINSLRGTQKSGRTMKVSKIYAEAQPYFFNDWPLSLRRHYDNYAGEKVKSILAKTVDVDPAIYEADIADLAKGERDPEYNFKDPADGRQAIGLPAAIRRLMIEREQKIEKIIRRGDRKGTVEFVDIILPGGKKPDEVE